VSREQPLVRSSPGRDTTPSIVAADGDAGPAGEGAAQPSKNGLGDESNSAALSAPSQSAASAYVPEIPGIVTSDAMMRLGGDIELLRTLLAHLIIEFSKLPVPEESSDAASLTALGERMHKLKGAAGNVGAHEIRDLASQVEDACHAHNISVARRYIQQLNDRLMKLRLSAVDWLEDAPFNSTPLEAATAPTTPEVVAELITLLKQQHFLALEQFHTIAPGLRALLGSARYDRVSAHIENLRFSDAVKELTIP